MSKKLERARLKTRPHCEWVYLLTLNPQSLKPANPRTESSPIRVGDLSTLTKEELTVFLRAFASKTREEVFDFATLQPHSIWNFLPFERLKELSDDEFQIMVKTQSLFSAADPSDKKRFFTLIA